LPEYEICFRQPFMLDEPLLAGDAIRWVGPDVWRVEGIDDARVAVRLWPDDVPYPDRIRDVGPGEWPEGSA
jgi:hypothetical protein